MITIEETLVVDAEGRATLTLPPSVKPLRAYPQGAYLKRVEVVCGGRIAEINRARIKKAEREGRIHPDELKWKPRCES